jgi:DinB superfamily
MEIASCYTLPQFNWRNSMHYRRISVALMVLSLAGMAGAQPNPFSNDARQHYELIKGNLLKAAQEMPAENYSFRTVPPVRTFAEMIAHVADAQVLMCAVVKGEKVTANAGSKKTKAELVAALQYSFDYCDPVYASMTDAAAAAPVRWARWDMSKLGLLNWNIAHDNEMYGIIGAFLRVKGLVPPSSAGRP